jgi:hypothetical protein
VTLAERLKLRLRFGVYAPLRLNRFPSYNLSCSQFGEDMIVRHLLADVRTGFYVDVGAHHPVYYSNTYHFYRRGWRGINVDAVPGSMAAFDLLRPRDVNVEACVDVRAGELREFIVFDRPALNTLSEEQARAAVASGQGRVVDRRPVRTETLAGLLDRHLPPGQPIHFLSLDVEGLDEAILTHHDFGRHRPRVLVFERHELPKSEPGRDPVVGHLRAQGYDLVALAGPSVVMQAAEFPEFAPLNGRTPHAR